MGNTSGDARKLRTVRDAACHGRTARGDGPVVSVLKTAPPDLTTLAKRRGGRFAEAEVTAFIVGPRPAARGTSDMPVWATVP